MIKQEVSLLCFCDCEKCANSGRPLWMRSVKPTMEEAREEILKYGWFEIVDDDGNVKGHIYKTHFGKEGKLKI